MNSFAPDDYISTPVWIRQRHPSILAIYYHSCCYYGLIGRAIVSSVLLEVPLCKWAIRPDGLSRARP